MAHYAIVVLVVKDPDALAEYFKVGAQGVAKHSGRAFAGGPNLEVLSNPFGSTKGVILEFPTAQHVTDWLEDPELKDVHDLRNLGADVTILSMPSLI